MHIGLAHEEHSRFVLILHSPKNTRALHWQNKPNRQQGVSLNAAAAWIYTYLWLFVIVSAAES